MKVDPHPLSLHGWATCPLPAEAMPGDEWTCAACGREFWADEEDDADGTFFWVAQNR